MAKQWPCKIGTMPSLVIIKSGKRPKRIGQRIDVRDAIPGSNWFKVRITHPSPTGHGDYFLAEKV